MATRKKTPSHSKELKTAKAYIVGIHRYSFRAGKRGEIIGIKWVKPNKDEEYRLCYEVKYSDGFIDYTAIDMVKSGDCEIIMKNQKNPPISR